MQRNILMIDLEGTIVSPTKYGRNYARPHAKEFLQECNSLFDKIYLNTTVPPSVAQQIMDYTFGFHYECWPSINHPEGRYKKTCGYEKIANHTIVQVDDDIGEEEKKDFKKFRVHYIEVSSYNPKQEEIDKEDMGLVEALDKIHKVLGE